MQVSVEVIARGVKDRKSSAGLGIVKFASESSAVKFASEWEGKELDGRPVWVSRYVSVAAFGEHLVWHTCSLSQPGVLQAWLH